ncbi:MAG: bifunctional diaminohydroxyphosphoribosylaminopyrimidine deaminase/5-amino-6-(5-phosphoribosylamino)uracil reductase RibD [Pseudomonadota bacterium]
MFNAFDYRCMSRALQLAKRGLYTAHPNPRVGCVIALDQQIIAEGWHRKAGSAHAELDAVNNSRQALEGGTAYVTLEPCSHHGKTPPCADLLIEQKVSRVVLAMQDPNPLVSGNGIQKLRDAGIQVESGLLEEQALALNPGFVSRMSRGRPWVRVKLAMSLDGRTALASGESRWITNESSRADVHRWRAQSDCILTGSNTVLFDDPALTVRYRDQLDINWPDFNDPLRAVIDSKGRTLKDAQVFNAAAQTVFFSLKDHGYSCESIVIESDEADGEHLSLKAVLEALAEKAINEVHVEAGASLCGALLQHRLVDEVLLYQAPIVLGPDGKGIFDISSLTSMSDRVVFRVVDTRHIGDNLRKLKKPNVS